MPSNSISTPSDDPAATSEPADGEAANLTITITSATSTTSVSGQVSSITITPFASSTPTDTDDSPGTGEEEDDVRHIAVTVNFDDVGLSSPSGDIPGVTVYTPAIGDILVDGWIEVVTAFHTNVGGVDILPDLYLASTAGSAGFIGWWANNAPSLVDLNQADGAVSFQGDTGSVLNGVHGASTLAVADYMVAVQLSDPTNFQRYVPAKWKAVDPLVLVVSSDGTSGGNDPQCDAGQLIVHLLVIPA